MNVTEAANEAKDNVKFLYTLERFIEPLYSGTATTIIDTLPALMNSIKMIHTIARYTWSFCLYSKWREDNIVLA